jgi:hypothetical protein
MIAHWFQITFLHPVSIFLSYRQIASRVVSARVQARETLIEIARAVGAPYFHFILTDLQRALKRGYQLHVLGHTLHALLAAVQTQVWTVIR